MTGNRTITELDLLAYADGRLDDDPGRRAEVEEALRDDPALAARAEAYRAQTEVLRRAYGPRVTEPVPERLRRIVEEGPDRPTRAPLRAAAVLALMASTGAAGWIAGQREGPDERQRAQAFLEHVGTPGRAVAAGGTDGPRLAGAGPAAAFGALARQVSFLQAPDLSELGYRAVARRIVEVDGRRTVRFTYRGGNGGGFHLFLRPRWKDRDPEIRYAARDGVNLAYWMEGPLASAVAAEMPREELRAVVEAVRRNLPRRGTAPRRTGTGPGAPVPGKPGERKPPPRPKGGFSTGALSFGPPAEGGSRTPHPVSGTDPAARP